MIYKVVLADVNQCGIKPLSMPMKLLPNGKCVPWYPHNDLRVNTIFEAAKAANFITAYADKHPVFEVCISILLKNC